MSQRLDSPSLVVGGGRPGASGRRYVPIDLEISAFGRPLHARAAVADSPLRLADVVPLARQLADDVSRLAARRAEACGKTVSCEKGCAVCCRYLVPISVPETFRLAEEIESLPPGQRRAVLTSFNAAARTVLGAYPKVSGALSSQPTGTSSMLANLGQWYARLELNCPLLSNNLCTLYPLRPTPCREYLMTSSPRYCEGFQPGKGEKVELPLSVLEALVETAAEAEETEHESVLLPLVPAWAAVNHDRARRTWPGPWLVKRFLAILQDLAARSVHQGAAGIGHAA